MKMPSWQLKQQRSSLPLLPTGGVLLFALALFWQLQLSRGADLQTLDLCQDYDSCFDCADAVTPQDYVQFKYYACFDQLNILPNHIECNPFPTDNYTYSNETLRAGEYRHYHWTLTTYALINHEAGASVTFEVIPEYGFPQMYTKAQILYAGMPMCQMFETQPGTEGIHTSTWPFPDRNTGSQAQGPEIEIAELEKNNTPNSMTYQYPGSVFSEVTWGFNASGYDSDKRPKVHTLTIPHVSYGGYFVSVYAGDGVDASYSIRVNAVRNIDVKDEETEFAIEETPAAVKYTAAEWWTDDYCSSFNDDPDACAQHCCTYELVAEEEFDFRRRLTDVGTPAFERKLSGGVSSSSNSASWPRCVQSSIDNLCISDLDSSASTGIPEPTVLVSFHTGSNPDDKYKLYYVEMNDCASQMDRNGQEYCWEQGWYTDGGRLEAFHKDGGKMNDANYQDTCGYSEGECDPTLSTPGHCHFDGSGSYMGEPAETLWAHAYDCIVWTPSGLSRHGAPVWYTEYLDAEGEWQGIDGDTFTGDVAALYGGTYDNSLRLKGIVTGYDMGILERSEENDAALYHYNGWMSFPSSTWITTQIGIYNNITYFFNVLQKDSSGTLKCYKGTQARTKFWRQTTLIPVEMIEIIAVIVVVALLALLVPFVLTKRKITAHLRDVYESHKYKGYLRGVEERVVEHKAKMSSKISGDRSSDEDVACLKSIEEDEDSKKSNEQKKHRKHHHHHRHHHHNHKKRPNKHQIQPIMNVPDAKEEVLQDFEVSNVKSTEL